MLAKFWKKEKNQIIPLLLFLCVIIVGILGQYNVTSAFIFVFPIPLYFLLRRLNLWQAFTYGLNFGFYFAFSSDLWLTKFEKFDPFILAVLAHGLVFGIVFTGSVYLMRRYKNSEFFQIFSFAGIFLLIQVVLHYFTYAGYAKAFIKIGNNPGFFDWLLPYAGSGAVDTLIFALGFLLARGIYLFLEGKSLKKLLWYAVFFAVLIGVWMLRLLPQSKNNKPPVDSDTVRIVAIQGNYGIDWDARVAQTDSIVDFFLNSTRRAAVQGAKIVIWPEYATTVDILTRRPDISKKIAKASKDLDVVIVMGSMQDAGPNDDTDKGIGYDLSLVFDPDKGRLEPYRAVYPYSDNIFHGTKPIIFETKYGNFPVLSCFEIARHKFVADYFHKGKPIDFIVAIGNNQVFDGTYGLTRLRNHASRIAGENDRYLMYVTNTAPTAIYDNKGEIVAMVPYQTRGYILTDVQKIREVSLYSRFQDLVPLVVTTTVFAYAFLTVKTA